jgi:hypothetical protein
MDENGGRWRIITRKRRFQIDKMCTVIAYFFASPEKRGELEEILRGPHLIARGDGHTFSFFVRVYQPRQPAALFRGTCGLEKGVTPPFVKNCTLRVE